MYCPHCGTALAVSAQRFCQSCGGALGSTSTTVLPVARPHAAMSGLAVKAVLVTVGVLMFVPFVISLMFGALFAGVMLVAALVHVVPVLAVIMLLYWLVVRHRPPAHPRP